MSKYTYLLIDLGALIVPFIFSFDKRIEFIKQWKSFWPAALISSLIFIGWDIYYTEIGVWGFNDRYLIGTKLFGLPLEEILFFICIPYSSVFTYYCFERFNIHINFFSNKFIPILISILLLVTSSLYYSKLYTSVTFFSLALLLAFVHLVIKAKWLSNFLFTYLIILIPFFIVNGLLTGTGLEEPIVWYNDKENLGIRILTIPIEDIFYGLLLLLLNTLLFEFFRKKYA